MAVALAAMATLWAFDPDRYWRPSVALGVTLALGTLVHFLIAVAPERYASAACDMISITYVVALGLGGLTFAAVAALAAPLRLVEARLTAMVVAGGVVGTVSAIIFPGVPLRPLRRPRSAHHGNVFAVIAEVQSLGQRILADPATGFAFAFPALVALVLVVILVVRNRGERRIDWLIAGVFLLVAVVLMMIQIRGARFAAAFAIPAGGLAHHRGAARLRREGIAPFGSPASSAAGCSLRASCSSRSSGVIAPGSATAAPAAFADVACFNAARTTTSWRPCPRASSWHRHALARTSCATHRTRSCLPASTATRRGQSTSSTSSAPMKRRPEQSPRSGASTYVADCANGNAAKLTEWEWLTALPGEGTLSIYAVKF